MGQLNVGVIHPGTMGITVAATVQNRGHNVYWASAGRSAQSRKRAAEVNLHDAGTIEALAGDCSLVISVCPPHAAEAVAVQIVAAGFSGTYLEANAISPQRTKRIAQTLMSAGVQFVDGGIVGPPASKPGTTRLYLSGEGAEGVAECFAAGPMAASIVSGNIGQASALKMCYAAYNKGSIALLGAVLAVAEELGVRDDLMRQWEREGSGVERRIERVGGTAAKAWRFTGEMDEIAQTFAAAGVAQGFPAAAKEIYERLSHFRGREDSPELDEVLKVLRNLIESDAA